MVHVPTTMWPAAAVFATITWSRGASSVLTAPVVTTRPTRAIARRLSGFWTSLLQKNTHTISAIDIETTRHETSAEVPDIFLLTESVSKLGGNGRVLDSCREYMNSSVYARGPDDKKIKKKRYQTCETAPRKNEPELRLSPSC